MSTWGQSIKQNEEAADRIFAMLLCARVFVLKQFLDRLPLPIDLKAARRR